MVKMYIQIKYVNVRRMHAVFVSTKNSRKIGIKRSPERESARNSTHALPQMNSPED